MPPRKGKDRSVEHPPAGASRSGRRETGSERRSGAGRERPGPRISTGGRGGAAYGEDRRGGGKRPIGPLFYALVFLGILLVFAGLDLTILLSKLSRAWGIPVLLAGLGVLVLTEFRYGTLRALPRFLKTGGDDKEIEGERVGEGYGSAPVIYWSTLRESLIPYFWVLGAAMVAADLLFNIIADPKFADNIITGFGSFDISVTLLGLALVSYRFVPRGFERERDFVLVLFVAIFITLVLPVTVVNAFSEDSTGITDSPIVYNLLTRPMMFLVGLTGIDISSHGNWVTYELQDGGRARVGIATSCAGIYSQSLFISGFISYILVEYRRWDIRAALLLVAGVLTAWVANVLRMSIIVVIGSFYGEDAFLWAHKYLGTVIFFGWICIFWGVIFMVLKVSAGKGKDQDH